MQLPKYEYTTSHYFNFVVCDYKATCLNFNTLWWSKKDSSGVWDGWDEVLAQMCTNLNILTQIIYFLASHM
jgi:hypothetical protein